MTEGEVQRVVVFGRAAARIGVDLPGDPLDDAQVPRRDGFETLGTRRRGDGDGRGLLRLAEFLAGLLALVELGGEGLGGPSAQGLLDEPAGLAALAAGEAAGLDPGLALRARR